MSNVINKVVTLKLNKNWVAIHAETAETAFTDLAKNTTKALDIDFSLNEDGSYNLSDYSIGSPLTFEEWIKLPIRSYDFVVHTHTLAIRVPRIVICNEYSHLPSKLMKFSRQNVYLRDKGTCQYSGKKLKMSEATIDHAHPKSLGGKTNWENCVLASKEINFAKGNKTNKEAGLKLLRKPTAPLPRPVSSFIENKYNLPEWDIFLKH